MDWYIFLTPLLLLPIIFLFRLIGCGLDETGKSSTKTITLNTEPIPAVKDNPITRLCVTFGVKPAILYPFSIEPVVLNKPEIVLVSEEPDLNTVLGATESPAGTFHTTFTQTEPGMSCQCYVWIMRQGFTYDPDTQPCGTRLNPNQVPFVTLKSSLTLRLKKNPEDPPTTDYFENNFIIEAENS